MPGQAQRRGLITHKKQIFMIRFCRRRPLRTLGLQRKLCVDSEGCIDLELAIVMPHFALPPEWAKAHGQSPPIEGSFPFQYLVWIIPLPVTSFDTSPQAKMVWLASPSGAAYKNKCRTFGVIPCAMFQMDALSTIKARRAGSRSLQARATLSEIFPEPGVEAAAAGFVLAQLGPGTAPLLWIQDRLVQRETGRPFLAGLGLRRPLMMMQLSRPVDVMVAAEEGLRCKALAAVIAEIQGNPPAIGFTAMKRLALRAEASGVPCWLIRHRAAADLSAARDRWRIATLASAANPDDPRAPGDPRWRVERFRSRDGQPGAWVASHDRRAQDRLDLVAAVPDGAVAEGADADGKRIARGSATGADG
jgi:protein ImuA